MHRLTWNAPVTGFQVPGQVGQTRPSFVHFRLRNSKAAFLAPGTVAIEHVDDVTGAADEAEVDTHAATKAHAPVATGSHQDHVTGLTPRRELFGRTVVCCKKNKQTYSAVRCKISLPSWSENCSLATADAC